MNYNLEPKARALKDATWAREHRSLVESDLFTESARVALAQYVRTVSESSLRPAARAYMIAGAHEFLAVLFNLSEKPEVPTVTDRTNLDQNL